MLDRDQLPASHLSNVSKISIAANAIPLDLNQPSIHYEAISALGSPSLREDWRASARDFICARLPRNPSAIDYIGERAVIALFIVERQSLAFVQRTHRATAI